jgi:hypothetical protein
MFLQNILKLRAVTRTKFAGALKERAVTLMTFAVSLTKRQATFLLRQATF